MITITVLICTPLVTKKNKYSCPITGSYFTARRHRPRVTTHREDEIIIQESQEHPERTSVEHRQHLHLKGFVDTFRRRLHDAGNHQRVPARKVKLRDEHRADRFNLASQYIGQNLHLLSGVVFYGEKIFSSYAHGQKHAWGMNDTN